MYMYASVLMNYACPGSQFLARAVEKVLLRGGGKSVQHFAGEIVRISEIRCVALMILKKIPVLTLRTI